MGNGRNARVGGTVPLATRPSILVSPDTFQFGHIEHYDDSMLGELIVHATSREKAIERMKFALAGTVIDHGRIRLYYSQYFLCNELLHGRGGEIAYTEARDGQAKLRNQVAAGKHFTNVNALVLQKAPVHHPSPEALAWASNGN
jgi:acetyl/propionyl-CoA carboxylase alpha subunit